MNGSDYINASFIQNSLDEYYKYIACQGPTKETVVDFIRMLKLYNIKLVICACNEYEGQKLKCHRYWTDKINQNYNFYKNYYVSLKCEPIELDGCIIRELVVRYNNSNSNSSSNNDPNIIHEYEFTQFHFTNWPDHGVPNDIEPIMSILKEVRLRMFHNNNESQDCIPLSLEYMAVHCSAGCGRTGTIIAIDQVWTLIEENKLESDFNLFKIARALREQRIAMIQTFSQYQFFARAVAFLFENFMLKQQKIADKYINTTSKNNNINNKFEKFIAPLKVNDDDNEDNNQNEELNIDTNSNAPVDNNIQKSINNNNLLTPPKSPYELNNQQKVSNKKLTIDSFKKKVNKMTNFLTPSQKKYAHQQHQIDSTPLTIPQTTISTSSSSSNQNTPASSNASPNSTTSSSSSSSSTNPNSASYSNFYMRPSNLNNLTEEETNLLKFETPPKSSETSNTTLRSKKYPAQISTPIATSLLVSKPSNLQFGGNTEAKFNNDDDENSDYLKYVKKMSPSSPTSSDFITPSQTPSNIESCSTPSRSTPTVPRKLFANLNSNINNNNQESESSTSILTTTQRTDDLTIDGITSTNAYKDRTGSNQRIESGSAREFLSNRFNMNLQIPAVLDSQYIRNYNNLSSKYLNPNENSNCSNNSVYARVPILNEQQKSNLYLNKSLKLVENQIKFSKSEKTDLIPPSKAEIYDNLQLKNKEEYYNYDNNYDKNSSSTSNASNNNVSPYSYSISQNNKNNNQLEIKESNQNNDSDEISLEAPPKAPVRSKLKRFIPAKDLAKNISIDLNSTNQKTISNSEIRGEAYCDIPSVLPSNLSNCKKFNDIYSSHSQYTTTISNNNTQENQSFKKLLKSDKLMNKNRSNEVPNIVLRHNESQQVTQQNNDMIQNKQSTIQRANTANFRNGLFIRDFELQHDLKIKPQQITISTQESSPKQQPQQPSLAKVSILNL